MATSEFQQRWHEANNSLAECRKELNALIKAFDASRAFDVAEGSYQQWRQGWQQRKELAEATLTGTKAEQPAESQETLRKFVADSETTTQAVRDIDLETSRIQGEISEANKTLTRERNLLQQAVRELSTLGGVTEEQSARAEASIRQRTADYQEKRRLEYELSLLDGELSREGVELARLQGLQEESRLCGEWIKHLEACRSVLHRDNLPRVVADHYLGKLQTDINAFLDLASAPFRVTAQEDLSFEVRFVSGPKEGVIQPGGRLSMGERVVLALAFRLSVNSMFAEEVGLLCLDEPTAWLDDANLGCIEIALEKLRGVSAARSLQVILVTHERRLGRLFDRVIDLGQSEDTWQ